MNQEEEEKSLFEFSINLLTISISFCLFLVVVWPNDFYQVMKEWQTLISGLLALLGAGLTVSLIREQINLQSKIHEDGLLRKGRSIRAQMPDALSILSDFSKQSLDYVLRSRAEFPEKRPEAIEILAQNIEYVTNDSWEEIQNVTSFYQILISRLGSFDPQKTHPSTFEQRVYDCIYFNLIVTNLFSFAREETQIIAPPKITVENLHQSLRGMDSAPSGVTFSPNLEAINALNECIRLNRIK